MDYELLFTDPFKVVECEYFLVAVVTYLTEILSRRR